MSMSSKIFAISLLDDVVARNDGLDADDDRPLEAFSNLE